MRNLGRATLYASVVALVIGWSLLAPKNQALAQPSGVVVPASGTLQALPVPARQGVVNSQRKGPAINQPLLTLDPVGLQKAKAAAADSAAALPSRHTPATSHAAIRPYSVFNGNNFPGIASNGTSTPPDSTGAAGPSYYVEMVNSTIGVRLLGSSGFTTSDLATFGAQSTSDCAFDPQISWDQQGGRWLYSFDDQVPTTSSCATIKANYVAFGWSKTSNPSDLVNGWCRFVVPTGTDFFDYDKLGHDNNFITIGANVFANSGNGAFETAVIVSISKPARGSTACTLPSKLVFFGSPGAPLKNADSSPAFTPVPAITTDSFGAGYIVAAHHAPASSVMVWHVTSSSGTPVLTADGDISVATFGVPPNIPQPVTGTTSCSTIGNCLDSLDGRLTQAVVRYDPDARRETIWTQHAVHDALIGALSVERWYELIPGLNTAPRQAGTVSDPALYIFNGAISPSLAGNEAVIFYNAGNGSAGGFASFRAQSRNTLTPLNTVTNETVIASSTVNDNDFSCGVNRTPTPTAPCRWGDYSAARPDPADLNVVWGTNMLTGTGGTSTAAGWATQFAAYTPGCATASVAGSGSGFGGDIIAFTASSTGCNNPKYQFWLRYPNGSFALKQTFGSSNAWSWDTAGYAAGDYYVYLWANQGGDSTNNWESYGTTLVHLAAPVPCSSGGLTPANPSVPAGSTINFTASASGCSTPVFEYWIQDPKGTWTIKRSFSTTPTFAWDTTGLVPGTYTVHAWVNQRGDSTSTFETFGSTTVTLTGCTAASLNPSTVAQPAGAPVNFTASSVGCLNPLYEFWVGYPNGTWVMKQTWGGPNFSLVTSGLSPGRYSVHVWANQTGASLATWEANGAASVALNICTSAALSPTSQSAPAGSTVPLSATFTDCLNPQFEYWAQYPNGTWHLARGWGAAAFSWSTAGLAPGTYNIHVWANNIGDSTATWEAYGAGTVTLTGCTSATVTFSVVTEIRFHATSAGCTATPVYEFWLQDPKGNWTLMQGFSTSPDATWGGGGTAPPGLYHIHVWANNQGADTSTFEALGTTTYTHG